MTTTHNLEMESVTEPFDASEKEKVAGMVQTIKQSIKAKTMELEALKLLLKAISKND
jgi:hypothetical protein